MEQNGNADPIVPDCIPDDVHVCNCARCKRVLIALQDVARKDIPSRVRTPPYGYINRRPYCKECYVEVQSPGSKKEGNRSMSSNRRGLMEDS
jgi:hypothetical protein